MSATASPSPPTLESTGNAQKGETIVELASFDDGGHHYAIGRITYVKHGRGVMLLRVAKWWGEKRAWIDMPPRAAREIIAAVNDVLARPLPERR